MKKFLLAIMASLIATSAFAEPTITLTPANVITLRDEVSEESASRLIIQLMEHPSEQVYLYINSPGGSIVAGFSLVNAIRDSGKKVTCIASFAASMAFSILQSCDRRLVTDAAVIMQHQASYEAKGSVAENKKTMELVEKLANKLNVEDAKRLGLDLATFKAKIHDEWWLFDDEIVQSKAADAEVPVRCSAALAKKREVQVIESLFGTATIIWSGCPLATYPVAVEVKKKQGVLDRDFQAWTETLQIDNDWKTRRIVK